MDYGRSKAFLDAHAALLLNWLLEEESLLLSAPRAGEDGAAVGEGEALSRGENAPVQRSAGGGPPPFGILVPHAGISLADVRAAIVRLNALFSSRVKTIPGELLEKYKCKARAIRELEEGVV